MAKGLIGLLAGVPSKGGAGGKGASASAGASDPETMAAEDFISAVQSEDAAAVKAAFRRMYTACQESEPEEEMEEEEY